MSTKKSDLLNLIKANVAQYARLYDLIDMSTAQESSRFCCLQTKDDLLCGSVGKDLERLENTNPYRFSDNKKEYMAKAVSPSRYGKYHPGDVFGSAKLRKSLAENPILYGQCVIDLRDVKGYLASDDYGNELINGLVIHEYTVGTEFNKMVNVPHTFATCPKWGLYISHMASERDLNTFLVRGGTDFVYAGPVNGGPAYGSIESSAMMDIISQVACTIDFLQEKGHFIHGNLISSNILIDRSSTVNGTHKGVKFGKSKIRVILNDFSTSAINIKATDGNTYRTFNEVQLGTQVATFLGDFRAKVAEGNSCLAVPVGKPGDETMVPCRNSYWWKLPSYFDTINFILLAHSGLPFYKSIDFYIFMVSLYMTKSGYNGGINAEIYTIWSSLWKESDLMKITKMVTKYHDRKHDVNDVLSVLRNFELRCDAIEYVLELLKRAQKP